MKESDFRRIQELDAHNKSLRDLIFAQHQANDRRLTNLEKLCFDMLAQLAHFKLTEAEKIAAEVAAKIAISGGEREFIYDVEKQQVSELRETSVTNQGDGAALEETHEIFKGGEEKA